MRHLGLAVENAIGVGVLFIAIVFFARVLDWLLGSNPSLWAILIAAMSIAFLVTLLTGLGADD